ncbi:uncharacterized protein [Nicotiana tomentosiformis]|uniref:uncharacterized protein n=1 Tax=Nicotiana tomentosiformis TaxID=4098 RepID=UPI00388CC3CF
MLVTDYETRLSELSLHAPMILPTDAERVQRFVAGLHPNIRASMAWEVDMGTGYQLVVEIAWMIEGYRYRGRSQMQQDKRTHFSGEFRGAPARGRGQFGRGQPSRPTYSAPPHPRGASLRPYINVMPESSYRPPVHRGSSSTYLSAMAENSYRPPAIQGSSSGYLGHQGQTSGQKSMVPRGCYECGHLDHIKRSCPRLWGKAVQQVSTLVGDYVVVNQIYRSCVVTFYGYKTRADLLLLDMTNLEVILGMDWLSPYYSILDFHSKTVTFAMPELPRFEWKGSSVNTSSRVISFLKARHMVEKGCLAYLAYVRDTTAESPMIDSVLVILEFANVFPSNLPGMPPDCDIDFRIDLAQGTQPISIPLYHMAPKELKEQLEEFKANVVADALSKKAESMGSLEFISAEERLLALDVQSLANGLVTLDISEPSRVLACVVAQSSRLGQIKARQFDDPYLAVLREMVLQGSAKEVSIGDDGVL